MLVNKDQKTKALEARRKKRLVRFLPIALDVRNKPVLMVGGGKIALQKLKTIMLFHPKVTVVAKDILPEIKAMGVRCWNEEYSPRHLDPFFLTYACTSNKRVNRRVARDAAARNILCNVADDIEVCDFISPAVLIEGDLTIAVNSQGRAPRLAREARDYIKQGVQAFLRRHSEER